VFVPFPMPAPNPIRSPYCVEGNHFKLMSVDSGGAWFKCDRCGHTARPQDLKFQCTCPRCLNLLSLWRAVN
jgi:Zn finger protein HypA/HybF involved in hydrogenase expression